MAPGCRQDEINELIVELAREGKRVVRLKGGDPTVFGRVGEEVAACRAAGIPVSIVAGVTAAAAAAASLNLSLTHRDVARRVQFVTGHDRHGRLPSDLDLAALADPQAPRHASTWPAARRRISPENSSMRACRPRRLRPS